MQHQDNGSRATSIINIPAILGDTRQTLVGVVVLWLLGQILGLVVGFFVGLSYFLVILVGLQALAFYLSITIFFTLRANKKVLDQCKVDMEISRREIARLEADTKTGALLAALDDSLLRLISEVVGVKDKATAMRNLQAEFLRDLTKLFRGDVFRASLLRPHATEPYLVRTISIEMPGPDGKLTDQYIGPSRNIARGSAGKAFYEKRVIVTRMPNSDTGEKGNLKEADYITSKERGAFVPYKVCVSVPIMAPDKDGKARQCLGVYCLDSMRPDVFDYPKEDIFLLLGRRIAAAIMIYERLRQRRPRTNFEADPTAIDVDINEGN